MKLHSLKPAEGSVRENKRIGRGQGSGRGGTSTKGHKGGQSRTGYKTKKGFEGGQMPLQRRVPKFGFRNPFRVEYIGVNLSTIQSMVEKHSGISVVDHETLFAHGIISDKDALVKVLAKGAIKAKLQFKLNKYSEAAKAAIEAAGGSATELNA